MAVEESPRGKGTDRKVKSPGTFLRLSSIKVGKRAKETDQVGRIEIKSEETVPTHME